MSEVEQWISAEFQRLAEVINDYDNYLFLEMVPVAEQADLLDKSKILRIVDDRNKKIVMYASMIDSPVDILDRLFAMDQQHNTDILAQIDRRNAAIEALQNEEYREKMEALKSLVEFIGKNQKSRWHHEGRVRDEHFNDLGPVRKHIT